MTGGTNPIATFAQSNYNTQTTTTYPVTIDGNWAVSQRFVDNFAPHGATIGTATVTMTIASPCVVTWTGSNLIVGQTVVFSTTGALPTGITAGVTYFVIAAGLTANTFEFSATLGGTAVVTTGTQSGTHTAVAVGNMTVVVDAGHLFIPQSESLLEIAQQTTATITAPVSNPRIDRIVANQVTGVVQVVTGTESSSPVVPSLPSNTLPIAQVALQTTTAAISNNLITDERALWGVGTGGGFNSEVSIASASTTDLGAANSNTVAVTGSTTITSFGSSASISAPIYIIRFLSNITLTNSLNLLCPGNVDCHVPSGDSLIANYLGSGNWRVISPFTGTAVFNNSVRVAFKLNAGVTGTFTPDFSANVNYNLPLTGNVTLANPTNSAVGHSGIIVFVQDATGGRALSAVGTLWKFPGGAVPTLTTGANGVDVLSYVVMSGGNIAAVLNKGFA